MRRWGVLLAVVTEGKTVHQSGLPEGLSAVEPIRLPRAQVLVIEERDDGFFLTRHAEDGAFAGDTWHMNLSDAMGQAEFEFGVAPTTWLAIPAGETNPLAFVRSGH